MNGASTVLSGVFAGRYLIERELGRGGTAIVYLARDQQRGHPVAIKILRPEFAESIGAERFLKEIRLTQQLHHPQIVPVLDSGKHDGQLFFVLPHMEGGTLRDRLHRDKQLTLEEVVAITQAIANALVHAHEKGLVHRDVKPENILFTSGQACLSDFGIARALESAMGESTTSTSVVRGTPPYMSPEQASGEKSLDGRSDIYSFGCVVYEMLAGMQPFVGPTPQSVIAQRLIHPPRPIRMYRPGLPTAVESVLNRALAVSRADRFQKATDFADALDAASRTTDDVTFADDVAPRRRRRLAIAATIGAVTAIAAAIVVTNGMGGLGIFNRDQGPGPAANANRIAVRYFEAPADDSQLVAVAGGLTRDLIDALRRVPALTLISPEGVRRFARGTPVDSLARVLNVGTVVTGTLERRGDSIRVDVRLVDGHTLVDGGSASAVYPAAMLVHLRDTVVQQVAAELRRQIGPRVQLQEWRAGTRSRRAWELRQRAQQLIDYERDLPRRASDFEPQLRVLVTAESLLTLATREDPAWTDPIVERGWLQLRRAEYLTSAWKVALFDSAAQQARQALARRPADARALELRGSIHYNRWTSSIGVRAPELADSSEADLRAALMSDRHLARAWMVLSSVLDYKGDSAGSADAARRAIAEDAFLRDAGPVVMRIFFRYLMDRKYDSARAVCARARAQFTEDAYVQSCELSELGWAGAGVRDVARIRAALQRTESRGKWPLVDSMFPVGRYWSAAVLARTGMTDSARAVMFTTRDRLRRASRAEEYLMNEAQVWVLLGERDTAMAVLERAIARAPARRAQIARIPWFDALRTHPRYTKIVGSR